MFYCVLWFLNAYFAIKIKLFRALGDHFYKKNEALPLEDQMISSNPDVNENKLEPDDEFVIVACDGIWFEFICQNILKAENSIYII